MISSYNEKGRRSEGDQDLPAALPGALADLGTDGTAGVQDELADRSELGRVQQGNKSLSTQPDHVAAQQPESAHPWQGGDPGEERIDRRMGEPEVSYHFPDPGMGVMQIERSE